MVDQSITQLSQVIEKKDAKYILKKLKYIYKNHYSLNYLRNFKKTFYLTEKLFKGRISGYRACNTVYHDHEHTLDVLITTIILIDGYNIKNHDNLPEKTVFNILIAALFHDCGYIQEEWDVEGTGAKYTSTHVSRGIAFINKHYKKFNIPVDELDSIGRIISATDYTSNFKDIDFINEEEKTAGAFLGTADLLGQISSRTYLEKLLFLYYEFKEAGIPDFKTEFDIIQKTAEYYKLTQEKLQTTFFNLYRCSDYYFQERHGAEINLFVDSIDKNIQYLNKIIDDDSSNFRTKLKRRTG